MSACRCGAYSFPHREGAGKCHVGLAPVCKQCGEICDPARVDVGIGPYEYWGRHGVDRRMATVSKCCEAEVIE